MLRRLLLLATSVFVAVTAPRARAWGKLGHEAIGTLASELLHPAVRQHVKKLTGSENLADASTWLDEVRAASRKNGPLVDDKETQAFNKKFPENSKWHFTNFPLGADAYSEGSHFASPDDAIHAIHSAVAVLEGKSSRFTPEQALKVIVHVVEDIHQPLHVGEGFFDVHDPAAPKLVTAPGSTTGKTEDLGGNKVQFGKGRFDSLHAYWDETMVEHLASTSKPDKLAAFLKKSVKPAAWKSPGDYHAWADAWATDSLHEAAKAYAGLTFNGAKMSASGKSVESIDAEMTKDYEATQKTRVQAQLAKAAFHLAELLNTIEWKAP